MHILEVLWDILPIEKGKQGSVSPHKISVDKYTCGDFLLKESQEIVATRSRAGWGRLSIFIVCPLTLFDFWNLVCITLKNIHMGYSGEGGSEILHILFSSFLFLCI